jgi:hypothetical protein
MRLKKCSEHRLIRNKHIHSIRLGIYSDEDSGIHGDSGDEPYTI